MNPRLALAIPALLLLSAVQINSQVLVPPVYAEPVAYPSATGELINLSATRVVAHSEVIHMNGAPSVRVFFRELILGPQDYVDVTGLEDNQRHRITPDEARKWDSSSAYFNGESVLVQLSLAGGSRGSYIIDHVLIGLVGVDSRSFCGSDDRAPSTDNRAARFLNSSGTSACSGWLGPNNCGFTAGHCTPTYANVAEFNVPSSSSNGALRHPSVEHQFSIDSSSITYTNSGMGNDFMVSVLFQNNLGEFAFLKYGFFNISYTQPAPNNPLRITGYGSDSGSLNQVQQTHVGPYYGTSGTRLQYRTDTTGGNSGSPVIDENTNSSIGTHTHAGCTSSGGYNTGTSANLRAFKDAITATCVSTGPPNADFTVSQTQALVSQSIAFTDTSTGGPTAWAWDFDNDGTIDATQSNPVYAYSSAGIYTVSLTAMNANGQDTQVYPNLITVTSSPGGTGLTVFPPSVSISNGGTQLLSVDAGTSNALSSFLVAGTLSGTSPGIPFGSSTIPINYDGYTLFTLLSPSTSPLVNFAGNLDVNGRTTAAFILPGGLVPPSMSGSTLHHAALVLTGNGLAFVTNAAALNLIP